MNIIAQLPNAISLTRLAAMPALLWLAWHGFGNVFLLLLAACFFSDLLDGWIARKFHLQSDLGSTLDSCSDFFIYSTMALGGWWLWPEIVMKEFSNVMILIACFVAPAMIGLAKFHRFTSYHTWSVKLAALLVGIGTMWLFASGSNGLFLVAVPVCVVAAIEEILITLISAKPQSNVPTLWHAVRRSTHENVR